MCALGCPSSGQYGKVLYNVSLQWRKCGKNSHQGAIAGTKTWWCAHYDGLFEKSLLVTYTVQFWSLCVLILQVPLGMTTVVMLETAILLILVFSTMNTTTTTTTTINNITNNNNNINLLRHGEHMQPCSRIVRNTVLHFNYCLKLSG